MRRIFRRGAKKLAPEILFLLVSIGFLWGILWIVRHFGLSSDELRVVILLLEFWIIWEAFLRRR